jgi:hypothetical protein
MSLRMHQIPKEIIGGGVPQMYNFMWNKEEMPEQWLESTAAPTDMGNKTEQSSYIHTYIQL